MTDRHARQPPLAGRYWLVVAVALLALAPYIVLSTSSTLTQQATMAGAHLTMLQQQLADALSNAGYAFGAVLASWLVQRFHQRTLFIVTESGFVVGSAMVSFATRPEVFLTGRILQGAMTGLMLVIALPPLITRFPASRLPATAVAVNLGLFGAVCAGPVIGGVAATGSHWRLLYAAAGVLGALAVGLGGLCLERFSPFDTERDSDVPAFGLALAATSLPFFGVAQLASHAGTALIVWLPVLVGLVALLVLLVLQRLRSDALIPVSPMARLIPLCGLGVAMVAGAVSVAALELVQTALSRGAGEPSSTSGLLFLPAVPGVVIAALLFGRLLMTRWIPVFVLGGLLALTSSVALMSQDQSRPAVLVGSALLGAGAGATVSPGLFLAAWSVRSRLVGRVFALVELLRAEAAYLVGPVLLHLAVTDRPHGETGRPLLDGVRLTMTVALVIVVVGSVVVAITWLRGRVPLRVPQIEAWLDGDELAIDR